MTPIVEALLLVAKVAAFALPIIVIVAIIKKR